MPELAPVRVAIISPDVVLSGAFTHDGVALAAGDSVLVAQPSSALNGPYTVQAEAWTRRGDWDTIAEMLPGSWLTVLEGATPGRAGSEWYFANPQPPAALGTTVLNWQMRARGLAPKFSTEFEDDGTTVSLADVVGGGTFTNPTLTVDPPGRIVGVSTGTVPTTFIEGLRPVFASGTSVTVRAGAAFIPGLGRILEVPADVTKSGLSLTASTWYYLYLWENAGVADVEVSTQAPAAPYRGSARIKGGAAADSTRRYIGALRTSAAASIRKFVTLPGGLVRWVADQNTTLRAVDKATNTTYASVDIGPFCPPTAEGVEVVGLVVNTDSITILYISAAGDGLTTVGGSEDTAQMAVGFTSPTTAPRQQFAAPIALFGQSALHYRQTGTGTNRVHSIDVIGYYEAV